MTAFVILMLSLLAFLLGAGAAIIWWIHRTATASGEQFDLPRHHADELGDLVDRNGL